MRVSDIMSKGAVCVKDGDFITHARQLMRDHYLRGVVVTDEANRLVGMLNDQDIMRVTATRSNVTVRGYARECPTLTPDMELEKAAKLMQEAKINRTPVVMSTTDRTVVGVLSNVDLLKNMTLPGNAPNTVEKIMNRKVETCHPDDRVATVWTYMLETDYTGIPVVSKKGEPIGMITRRDILKSGAIRIGAEDSHGPRVNESSRVEKVMSTPVYTLNEDDSVEKAVGMILHYDIGRIPVVNDKKISGIIDRQDLLKVFVNNGTHITK
ncbi:MAG: CBS domain-containing protein [Methanosarcinaceae archaeon]|nr:CBS domain-containing protein [Methanosarcinaceae archaeon]MDD4496969.1 CBS domain-containing protein [Methanosarcinaceae archaeon]